MRVNKEIIQKNLKEDIFVKISEASDDLGVDSYVVGGYVRDLCLRRPIKKDIDVMCVGSGIELAQNFYKKRGLVVQEVLRGYYSDDLGYSMRGKL